MSSNREKEARYQRNPAVEAAPFSDDGQLLLFLPEVNKFFALNGTSSFIWTHMNEPSSLGQLAQQVSHNFEGVSPDKAQVDVDVLLRDLISMDLVREC